MLTIYTDGGSRNTGNVKGGSVKKTDKAAWAFQILDDTKEIARGAQGYYGATNNQMELFAVLYALKRVQELGLSQSPITLISDSKYVLNGIDQWLPKWKRNNWTKADKKPILNLKIWQAIDRALPHFPHLKFQWTKGHAGNSGNELVDQLLNQIMDDMN